MNNRTREDTVAEFHKAMDLPVSQHPSLAEMVLRTKLMKEEMNEVEDAMVQLILSMSNVEDTIDQWAHLLKELCDLQYVLSGTVVSIRQISSNFDTAFNRVHDSNMSKLEDGKPVKNDEGKVTKGLNYKEPDLRDLVCNSKDYMND